MDSPCINKGRYHIRHIESKIGCSLHKVNVFFAAKRIVKIFQGEIAKKFFGRLIGYLPHLFGLFSFFVFPVELPDFFAVKSDRIVNAICLQFMNISDGFVGAMGTTFAFKIIITFVNL